MVFSANMFDFNPETKEYCEEISMLARKRAEGMRLAPCHFTMSDCPLPGQHRSFRIKQIDKSGEDIAGWRYVEEEGPNHSGLKVLIIND